MRPNLFSQIEKIQSNLAEADLKVVDNRRNNGDADRPKDHTEAMHPISVLDPDGSCPPLIYFIFPTNFYMLSDK